MFGTSKEQVITDVICGVESRIEKFDGNGDLKSGESMPSLPFHL